MLIENEDKNISHICVKDKIYKAVDGIIDVPLNTYKQLISFPEWHGITSKIEDKILQGLGLMKVPEEPAKDSEVSTNKEDPKATKK